MLELPETTILAAQLNDTVIGRTVDEVLPPTKPHKFCFFSPEVEVFRQELLGLRITGAEGFGIYAEIIFDNNKKLCISDGVNLRLIKDGDAPSQYQLLIRLDDGHSLVFTVAMYGGISLHDDSFDNKYYLASRMAVSPFSEAFHDEFRLRLKETKPTLSAKAFIATEQRFPGIGNGVLQDILFEAGIHPKRKISTLSMEDADRLALTITCVLREMIRRGGRDTEKDLFNHSGGYPTAMSKNTVGTACTKCGSIVVKENYMGGSVYFCPECQK